MPVTVLLVPIGHGKACSDQGRGHQRHTSGGTLKEMELVLQQTADSVSGAEHCIREISQRIMAPLLAELSSLEEDVPPGLAKIAQKVHRHI